MRTVILLYRPEAADHAVGDTPADSFNGVTDSFDEITDPFDGIEVYAVLDNAPVDLDDRLQDIAARHNGWKFHYETYDFDSRTRPELMVGR